MACKGSRAAAFHTRTVAVNDSTDAATESTSTMEPLHLGPPPSKVEPETALYLRVRGVSMPMSQETNISEHVRPRLMFSCCHGASSEADCK